MANRTDPRIVCLNLRSKEMLYADPDDPPSEHDAEVERLFGACDTSVYWCDCTQTGRGPDEEPANKDACSHSARRCFVGLENLT